MADPAGKIMISLRGPLREGDDLHPLSGPAEELADRMRQEDKPMPEIHGPNLPRKQACEEARFGP
jgi:hypothetical protein